MHTAYTHRAKKQVFNQQNLLASSFTLLETTTELNWNDDEEIHLNT